MATTFSKTQLNTLRKLIENPQADLSSRHEVGKHVDNWYGNVSGRAFGEERMKKLSQELGLTKTQEIMLDRCRKFYKLYPGEAEVEELNRAGLTWSYVRLLISVDDPQKRQQLAEQAESKKWTARDLQRQIQEQLGIRKSKEKPNSPDKVKILGPIGSVTLIRGQAAWWSKNAAILKRPLAKEPKSLKRQATERDRMEAALKELIQLKKLVPDLIDLLEKRIQKLTAMEKKQK